MRNKRAKMTLDFYKYLFFLQKNDGVTLILNLAIFVISVITLFFSSKDYKEIDLNDFFVVVLFLFSLFNVVWSTIGKIKEIKSFTGNDKVIKMSKKTTIIKENSAFGLKDIGYAQGKKSWPFENYSIDDLEENSMIRSRKLNEYLWDNVLKLQPDVNKKEKVQGFILKNRDIVTPFFQYKYYNSKRNQQYFFNEDKLCMASDIYEGKEVIRCHKSNYYNSFLTNEICMYALQRIEDATIIYDASNFFPCEYNVKERKYYLQHIEKSVMNNHIGVSTLAITEDNYLILRKQSGKTQQNRNKYVPTGSGSCDWLDIRGDNFTDTIIYAMKRELWEENGGKKISSTIENIGETKILGFFRWLQRGGKPEFVGITKLKCTLDAMEVDTDEFIDITSKVDMDTFRLDDIDDIPEIISNIKEYGDISSPLHMCIDALETYYKERPNELEKILRLRA